MMADARWYVLDSNEGEMVTAGGGAVAVHTFVGPLSARDGEARYSLRLWRSPQHPDEMPADDRAEARENCLLAVGSADRLAVELQTSEARYQVGRESRDESRHTIRFNLGHETTVHTGELFTAAEAAELFLAYHRTGSVPAGDYRLRELTSVDALAGSPSHMLTFDYDNQRAVLPTVGNGEFAAFLAGEDESSVLVLKAHPATTDEFIQTAGSAGRYTVEVRRNHKLFTVGHEVDHLVWDTANDVEILVGDNVINVYPNEVFTPAEVDALFVHYVRTGDLPGSGYLLGEIETTE